MNSAVLQREAGKRAGLPGELLGVLECTLKDEPSDRVDVHSRHVAPKAHRFEGNGAATGERVQHFRRAPAVRLANLRHETT